MDCRRLLSIFLTHGSDYVTYVIEHIEVSVLAVLLAMIVGIPLGIISARFHWFAMLSTGIWGPSVSFPVWPFWSC